MGQGLVFHHLFDMKEFGPRRLEKFFPGRNIAKQGLHLNNGTPGASILMDRMQGAVSHLCPGTDGSVLGPGTQDQPGNRRNTGNGLAPEAKGGDGGKLRFVQEF